MNSRCLITRKIVYYESDTIRWTKAMVLEVALKNKGSEKGRTLNKVLKPSLHGSLIQAAK